MDRAVKRTMRVLVIDDEKAVRTSLSELLQLRGYKVVALADAADCPLLHGSRAGAAGRQDCEDVVLSDVQMRRMSGLALAEALRRDGCQNLRIALMSGSWSDSQMTRAKALGCRTFQKPVLIETVESWLRE